MNGQTRTQTAITLPTSKSLRMRSKWDWGRSKGEQSLFSEPSAWTKGSEKRDELSFLLLLASEAWSGAAVSVGMRVCGTDDDENRERKYSGERGKGRILGGLVGGKSDDEEDEAEASGGGN